jgi:AraC family transcriptional regulator
MQRGIAFPAEADFLRANFSSSGLRESCVDRRIEAAIEIMEREIERSLAIRELGERVHLSPWHFTHLFKAQTGVSPKQYMVERKMRRAEELLDQSFLSVKEIAAGLGFGHQSHFSREFKKHCGTSPSNLRNRRRPQAQP